MFLYQYVRVTRIPGIEIELGKYWISFECHAYDQPPIVVRFLCPVALLIFTRSYLVIAAERKSVPRRINFSSWDGSRYIYHLDTPGHFYNKKKLIMW